MTCLFFKPVSLIADLKICPETQKLLIDYFVLERKARLYHITEELESAMIYSYSFQKGSRIASVKATQPSFLKALPQTGKRVDEGERRDRILKYMTKR